MKSKPLEAHSDDEVDAHISDLPASTHLEAVHPSVLPRLRAPIGLELDALPAYEFGATGADHHARLSRRSTSESTGTDVEVDQRLEDSTTLALLTLCREQALSSDGEDWASEASGDDIEQATLQATLWTLGEPRTLARPTSETLEAEVSQEGDQFISQYRFRSLPFPRVRGIGAFPMFSPDLFSSGVSRSSSLGTANIRQPLSQPNAIRRWMVKREEAAAWRSRAVGFTAFVAASVLITVLTKSGLTAFPAFDDRPRCKHGSNACEWEVVSAVPVQVRQRPHFTAPTLATKLPGSLVVGRPEDETWLRLAGEAGFMVFKRGDSKILKQREDIWYQKILHGSCSDHGRYPILDARSCEAAAMTLGMFAVVQTDDAGSALATAMPSHDGSRPEGCYMDATGTLRLNLRPNSIGNGELGGVPPICTTVAYPSNTTRTSATSTTSTPMSMVTTTTGSDGQPYKKTSMPSTTTSSWLSTTTSSWPSNTTPSTAAATRSYEQVPTLILLSATSTTSEAATNRSYSKTSTMSYLSTNTTTSTKRSYSQTTTLSYPSTNTTSTATTARSYGEPSLMCFSYMRLGTQEEKLVKQQLRKGAGIFACDESVIISSAEVHLGKNPYGEDVVTWENPPTSNAMGDLTITGVTTNSWLNCLTFIIAFDTILKDSVGRVWSTDFLVKVDPDAILLPDRLRLHVRPHVGAPVYFLNCKYEGSPVLFGAVEVYSKQAMRLYQEGRTDCTKELKWQGWGEDTFFSKCMEMSGAQGVSDFTLVGDSRCGYAPCFDHWRAAFHPFKDVDSWDHCWRLATSTRAN